MQATDISAVSEDTLLARWELGEGSLPGPEMAAMLGKLSRYLLETHGDVVLNVVPAYQTLMVQYDILRTEDKLLVKLIRGWLEQHSFETVDEVSSTLHTIPVFYDTSVGPDIEEICRARKISAENLVELHTLKIYTVYAVGFQPGFAYLGYVDERIAMPRLASFRKRVPAGSVGIADRQTAVYPSLSPGGWQIIGRTPMDMLIDNNSLMATGDRVRFKAIDERRFLELGGSMESIDG